MMCSNFSCCAVKAPLRTHIRVGASSSLSSNNIWVPGNVGTFSAVSLHFPCMDYFSQPSSHSKHAWIYFACITEVTKHILITTYSEKLRYCQIFTDVSYCRDTKIITHKSCFVELIDQNVTITFI